jgi:gluconate 5-dehydrogenase
MQRKIFDLEGKTILITGATGWLGSWIKNTLEACNPYKVITLNRDDWGDFYNIRNLEAALKEILEKDNVNVLINNAYDLGERTGFNTEKGTLEEGDWYQWENSFRCGIYWPVLATQMIGERMKKTKKGGSIINISSMYGVVSPHPKLYEGEEYFNPATYSTMKHGLAGLTKYTAAFWGKYNIRCNAIAPGPFPKLPTVVGPFMERLKERTLLGRVGYRADLDGIILLLASDAGSFITGQIIQVDGGWTVT